MTPGNSSPPHRNLMNREILRIALPAIIANVTVPLLGLVDVAIVGHMGNATLIGAVTVATMMFNLIYWNFGFLRMGTSGMTAQAYGRGSMQESGRVLMQSCALALAIALLITLLQAPLRWLCFAVIAPSEQVRTMATLYYNVVVWGATPVLLMMAIKGWMLGMQDSTGAMLVSVVVNVLNIALSVLLAIVLGWGFRGIAYGTLAAGWLGLLYALWLVYSRHRPILPHLQWRALRHIGQARQFFAVNIDIFVRSFLLMSVNLAVVSIGARKGDLLLAVNALIQQLNVLYAYLLDGVAFAGEALVGKYYGACNESRLRLCVRRLFAWASVVTLLFTVAYLHPDVVFGLLTNDITVVTATLDYRWWCTALPLAGMAAFVWDGVFIGLTRSRGMLVAVAFATALFFIIYHLAAPSLGNHALWLAFVVNHLARGAVQTVDYFRNRLYHCAGAERFLQ